MESSITVTGVAEAIRSLDSIEPGLRKEFKRDAKKILGPAIAEIQNSYPPKLLSGMFRNWTQKQRRLFPYDQALARRRVTIKIDASRRAKSVISIIQKDPAASIIEFAGKRNGGPFAAALDGTGHRPARFAWPAAERKIPEIQNGIESATKAIVDRVAREVRF